MRANTSSGFLHNRHLEHGRRHISKTNRSVGVEKPAVNHLSGLRASVVGEKNSRRVLVSRHSATRKRAALIR